MDLPSSPDLIEQSLRRAIIEGELPGGCHLKQNEIAARYDVSPGPVREAFQSLISRGLLTRSRNRGVAVTSVSRAELDDIFEQRMLLEPHALMLSASALSRGDLDRAEAILAGARGLVSPFERAQLHWAFHRTLYSKANRERLLAHIENLHDSIARYLHPVWATTGVSDDWIDGHLELVSLVRQGQLERCKALLVRQTESAARRVRAELDNTI